MNLIIFSLIMGGLAFLASLVFNIHCIIYFKKREGIQKYKENFRYKMGDNDSFTRPFFSFLAFILGVFWIFGIMLIIGLIVYAIVSLIVDNMFFKAEKQKERAIELYLDKKEYFKEVVHIIDISYEDCLKEAKRQIKDEIKNRK